MEVCSHMRIKTINTGNQGCKKQFFRLSKIRQKTVKYCEKQVKALLDFHERIINFMEAFGVLSTETGLAC